MERLPGASPQELAEYFVSGRGLAGIEPQPHHHGPDDGSSTSVRELEYRGHRARIETTYRITIDDRPLRGHVEVLPSGAVHYHRFPQYAPASAVDVVQAVIDTLWDRPRVEDELGAMAPEPPPSPDGSGDQHGSADQHVSADPHGGHR